MRAKRKNTERICKAVEKLGFTEESRNTYILYENNETKWIEIHGGVLGYFIRFRTQLKRGPDGYMESTYVINKGTLTDDDVFESAMMAIYKYMYGSSDIRSIMRAKKIKEIVRERDADKKQKIKKRWWERFPPRQAK